MKIDVVRNSVRLGAIGVADGQACLVIDADDSARREVGALLEGGGLHVVEAANLTVARAVLATEAVGVVLVDLRVGSDDGLALVRELADRPETSVMIVSASSDPADRILGIELGADDFVARPFHGRELLARVKRRLEVARQLRAGSNAPSSAAARAPAAPAIGRWTLDENRRNAFDGDGESARLTPLEFRTLYFLLHNRGRVLTRDEIHRYATGQDGRPATDRSIDAAISSLRQKLAIPGNRGIRTVHRVGYIVS